MKARRTPLLGVILFATAVPVFAQTADGDAAPSAEEMAADGSNAVPMPHPDSVPVESTEPASAQADEPERKTSRLVEEIIVTAQKREENLQDVPISISAFSAESLDARGITDPKDLPQATPGLTLGSQAGYTVTYLRGVGSDAFLLADPSVALYIDGIYFPFAHGQAQNFGSIERVEVLKGPQGTLFGRNAMGGAISVVTAAPDFSAVSGSVQTGYAEYDSLQTKASVNIPLSDTFALGVSAVYNAEDNYREGQVGRRDGVPGTRSLPREVSRGARLKLRWAPVEALDFTLAGFHLQQSGATTMFATNSDPSQNFSALIQPQRGLDGEVDAPVYFDLQNTVLYGQASLFTDWFDVKLIGSDQTIDTDSLYDFDGSPTPLVFFEAFQGSEAQTAEVQILSNDTAWASDRLNWILGYYYFKGRAGLDPALFGVAGSPLQTINDALSPVLGTLGLPLTIPSDGLLAATGLLATNSNSIFAQATYDFTDWAALTLGARLQDEERSIIDSGGAYVPPVGEPIPYTQFSGQSDTTRGFSPKASVQLRPWDDGLVYLAYQQAVKSSTFNVVNFLRFTEPEPVKKEELTAYELGIKTSLFGGGTTVSAAVFFYDIKNIQVQFLSLLAGGAVTFENAPAAEVKGIDFDITSLILPNLIDGLVFTAGGAFLDATFTDYPAGQGFDDAGTYSTGNNYTGKRVPRSPEFSGNVGLSQTLTVPSGSLEIAADYYYNGGFFYLAQNTAFNEEKAYGVLGARVSYLYEPWNLRATVFGKNILDERYNYSRFCNDFGGLDAVAPPAVYGMRLNWEF